MIEPRPTAEAQHRNTFVLRVLVVFGFAFLLLAVAPQAAHALDLGGALDPVTDTIEPVTDTIEPVTNTIEPVTNTVGQVVEPVTQTVADTVAPVTQTVADTVAPVTQTVADTVAPVTQTVAPVTQTVAPVTQTVADTLDPVTQTVTDPPVVPVDPPTVPQPPGVPSGSPDGHGSGHDGATTVGFTAGSAEAQGLVAETGISPVPTSTSSTSRSSQPSVPTPSSGQPIPALPPIAGAAAGQLVGGGSAGLNLVAVLAAAIALAFGWSRWFRLVQPMRVLAPFVSLAERPG
ncbi:MAG TPA: hypothetical protein VNG34_07385 [Actinomycetota bacterium]|nr:hypothetical protein [Actinomycetota bacterium]